MKKFRIRHGPIARVFVKPIGLRQVLAVWRRGYRPWLFGAWAKPNKAAREFERSKSVAAPVERHH